jgi:hypothetical protein
VPELAASAVVLSKQIEFCTPRATQVSGGVASTQARLQPLKQHLVPSVVQSASVLHEAVVGSQTAPTAVLGATGQEPGLVVIGGPSGHGLGVH